MEFFDCKQAAQDGPGGVYMELLKMRVIKAHVALWTTLLVSSLVLSACQPGSLGLPSSSSTNKPIVSKPPLTANVNGEKVGNGPNRIALLLPLTASGGAGIAAKQIANAARMALAEFGANSLQLVIKDTRGQSSAASLAASEARTEGATLVLGPLFSANVNSASAVTQPSGLPMIAFSSDQARARAGVYLLSFAPQADIERTLTYGLSNGADKIVAILPSTNYGSLVEREMRRIVSRGNGEVVSVARYGPSANEIVSAANSIALQMADANAIYIPSGSEVPGLVLNSLKRAGVNLEGKQVMGSGQWKGLDVKSPVFEGAFHAGNNERNFATFASRYKSKYGSDPLATAALGYDAVSLAAELVRRNPQQPFTRDAIQSRAGFNGASGLFRFQSTGKLERGLAIYRVSGGNAAIASPAPSRFVTQNR